jgi:hypothetical protein
LQILEQRKQRKVHFSLLSREKIRLEANNPKDIFLFHIIFVPLPLLSARRVVMSSEGDGAGGIVKAIAAGYLNPTELSQL